jgi:polyribonucleotide nucleotidyltransferase
MHQVTIELAGRPVTFETGAIARQATGAVLVSSGETVLMACVAAEAKPTRLDYMPLTTEYRHRHSASGRIPGSYERRETKPSEQETLWSRLVDRTIRPLFPETWCYDTQVVITPLSYDPTTDVPVLAISAAAAALMISTIPWQGPVVGARVARVDGALVAFPTPQELARGDLDLVVSANKDGIVMVEGGCREVAEDVIVEALALARRSVEPLFAALEQLRAAAGKPKRAVAAPGEGKDAELAGRVQALGEAPLREALRLTEKQARNDAVRGVIDATLTALGLPEGDERRAEAREQLEELKGKLMRLDALDGRRVDGRSPTDIRAIACKADWLKRTHGSSLFTRGETQAVVTCTLGTERDAQSIETLDGMVEQRFLLHYNFPPYCVGEVRPLRGPGRREIGHGYLARRALAGVLPSQDECPYTIRLESLITESNGSSSMASVCGGALALMDAGIPIRAPVAGIAMGLVMEGERFVVLSDILGDEDHIGDMDFKVAGTTSGVTAIQLDNKLGSLPDAVMTRALDQARAGRLHILGEMGKTLTSPRPDVKPHAPRVRTVRIEKNRIRDLIGQGGKTIRALQEATGVKIDIGDDGLVKIFGTSAEQLGEALARVEDLTGVPELGRTYQGRVVAAKPFGSFVRLFEGIEGLVQGVELTEGSIVAVRVSGVTGHGKIALERER